MYCSSCFTSNKIKAAPIIISQESFKDGEISAIVANSGNANCFNGKEGLKDALDMASNVSEALNLKKNEVAVASTGIIGKSSHGNHKPFDKQSNIKT